MTEAQGTVVRTHTTQLAIINQVAVKIASILNRDHLLQEIVTVVQKGLGYHHVALFLLDQNNGELILATMAGSLENAIPSYNRQSVGSGMIGWTAQTGRTYLAADVRREPRYIAHLKRTRSELCVPIQLAGHVIGVLDVQDIRSDAFDEIDLMAMETLAHQVAIAIHNARLYEETQNRTQSLRGSEARLRAIFETAQDAIFIKDRTLRYTQANPATEKLYEISIPELIGRTDEDLFGKEAAEQIQTIDLRVLGGEIIQEVLTKAVDGIPTTFHVIKVPMRDDSGQITGLCGIARDTTERERADDAIRRRNRELALLNRASQVLAASLEVDEVLATLLDEVRHLLEVVACSIWLINPETDELVCQQATGPQSQSVSGWRLSPGQGLAGWTVRRGESLIVPDAKIDERHFTGVDQRTGLTLRSILSVPLRVKEKVIGVLQVGDTEVDRFKQADQTLLESLAATAAITIDNARLYEQARQDAETRAVLLREVNHRVKNNLTAIIGLIYAESRYIRPEQESVYQPIMQDLVNRVQGLATVHSMLSASEWAPLLLSDLSNQIIRSSLQMLPSDKHISIQVTSSPVRVTADQAHSLALVLNELATNTAKHTLHERNAAQITVRIKLVEDTIRLEFGDDGPGYPECVLRQEYHNVGFDLIQNIVRQDLRGKLELENDRGTVVTIEFTAKVGETTYG
jgi:PAS domain S-box-containing protein